MSWATNFLDGRHHILPGVLKARDRNAVQNHSEMMCLEALRELLALAMAGCSSLRYVIPLMHELSSNTALET